MKIQTDKIAPCKQQIKADILIDKLNQKIEEFYSQVSKTAKFPGFRKGKIPRNILELHYHDEVKNKAIGETISNCYADIIKKADWIPIGLPQISDVKIEKDYLRFQATVEIRPEIELGKYKGIKLVRKEKKVSDADVEKQLKFLQQIKHSSQQKQQKKEENKEEKLPPLDDDFAQQMGKNSLKELKEAIREDLLRMRKQEADRKLESDLLEQILKNSNLDLPDSLVQKQKELLLKDTQNHLKQQGIKEEDINSHLKESEKSVEDKAIKQLKVSFILDKIVQQEKIEVSEEELNKKIEEIAQGVKRGVEEVKEDLIKRGLISNLKEELKERKVVNFLMKVNETTI